MTGPVGPAGLPLLGALTPSSSPEPCDRAHNAELFPSFMCHLPTVYVSRTLFCYENLDWMEWLANDSAIAGH